MKHEDWIDEENLLPVVTAIGWLCGYQITDKDIDAIKVGVADVDESKGRWFSFPLKVKGEILIGVTMEPGSSNYTIRVDSELDIHQGVESILGIAQCYAIRAF